VARALDAMAGVKSRNSTSGTPWFGLLAAIAVAVCSGCAATPACRSGVRDDATVAGRTAEDGLMTGAATGYDGLKTAGRTVKGAVEGGSQGAAEEWNEGKAETRATARQTGGETRADAETPVCP
jgi:hypothetical protein